MQQTALFKLNFNTILCFLGRGAHGSKKNFTPRLGSITLQIPQKTGFICAIMRLCLA